MADFQFDAAGMPSLHFDAFADSVFELADLWTNSISPAVYISFLKLLCEEVLTTGEDGNTAYITTWPPDPPAAQVMSVVSLLAGHFSIKRAPTAKLQRPENAEKDRIANFQRDRTR